MLTPRSAPISKSRLAIALAVFAFTATPSVFAGRDCEIYLIDQINRASNPAYVKTVKVETPRIVRQLTANELALFKPELSGTGSDGIRIELSVQSLATARQKGDRLKDKGIWILTSPTPRTDGSPSGHAWMRAGNSLFDRFGPNLRSTAVAEKEFAGIYARVPFVIAQFFELDETSVVNLNRFFHDRTWFHYWSEGFHDEYRTDYAGMPYTRNRNIPNGENCVTFACAWANDRWTKLRPELSIVRDEMGSMTYSEIPIKQVYYNTQSPAYRGTILLSEDPNLKQRLMTSDLREDPEGRQLLLIAPLTPAK